MIKLRDILEGINEMARMGNVVTLTQQQKDRINPNNYKDGSVAKRVATWMKNTNGPIKNADIATIINPDVPAVNRGASTNNHFKNILAVALGGEQPQVPQRQAIPPRQVKSPPTSKPQTVSRASSPPNVVSQRSDINKQKQNLITQLQQSGLSSDEIQKRVDFFNKVINKKQLSENIIKK